MNTSILRLVGAVMALMPIAAVGAPSPGIRVEHQMTVTLEPDLAQLSVVDRVRIPAGEHSTIDFRLAPHAAAVRVLSGGELQTTPVSGGRFRVPIPPSASTRELTVHYSAIFNDSYPDQPVYTDNPGFGVTGTIGQRGVFLLPGSHWYPITGGDDVYRMSVVAPAGMVAVTAGRRLSLRTLDGRTHTEWDVGRPVGGLALMAARYRVQEKAGPWATAATYFTPPLAGLADDYLASTTDYLERYSRRFGAYPFPAFSIVENFFPTGYGFPGYTVIGGRVLRLPFIRHTSLAHEIAHCWWGNGVRVDPRQGNWSEGLATYVADYMAHEDRGSDAAQTHRRRMIQNVTVLAADGRAFPLSKFTHRSDPASRAVGYDKGAMVFHMLRQRVGEDAFWSGLRAMVANHMFQEAGWSDFRNAMESTSGIDLGTFFDQWVDRTGAPVVRLAQVRRERQGRRWAVFGEIRQSAPFYELSVPIRLETMEGAVDQTVAVHGPRTPFILAAEARPRHVVADPEFHLLRRLAESEIPLTVNAFKTKRPLAVIVPGGRDSPLGKAARTVAAGLGRPIHRWLSRYPAPDLTTDADVLMVMVSQNAGPWGTLPEPVAVGGGGFRIADRAFEEPGDALFTVFEADGRQVAVLAVNSQAAAAAVARKITHYGTYSYLAFENGVNRIKSVWPVGRSPMIYRFENP